VERPGRCQKQRAVAEVQRVPPDSIGVLLEPMAVVSTDHPSSAAISCPPVGVFHLLLHLPKMIVSLVMGPWASAARLQRHQH